jgi:cytochrome d ubiquinol oxidase subunit II
VAAARFLDKESGIWFGGIGTVLVGLAIFSLAGYHQTAFYPSVSDLQSSLTIHNASSSHYTLTVMSYVALAVPLVIAYIWYVWQQMDAGKLSLSDLTGKEGQDTY